MRTWLEIDLNLYRKNLEYIRSLTLGKEEIMLIVKANCYGLGYKKLTQTAYNLGIRYFGVATIEEGVLLRKIGLKNCDIQVLGHTSLEDVNRAIKNNLILTITGKEHAQAFLHHTGKKAKISIAIDTGMHRIGFSYKNALFETKIIKELSRRFKLKSVFTHLAVADSFTKENTTFTKKQITRFFQVKKHLKVNVKWHYKNSAGLLKRLMPQSDLVRVGIIQYGIKPSLEFNDENLFPIFTWKAKIGCIRKINKGDCVGYGRTFKAEKNMKIATISVGYADGYNRLLSNRGRVIVNDNYCNIVGNVCMDQCMIDVSKVKNVSVGDSVILIGKSEKCEIPVEELAKKCSTISYEIMCNINSKRVKRVYVNQ